MKNTDLTVAILAGGNSERFKSEKALALFQGRPLLTHMIGIAKRFSPQTLVVVSSDEQAEGLKSAIGENRVAVDPDDAVKCALTGAVTAFEFCETRYILLLPVDTPLVKVDLLQMLIDLRAGHGAVVPSWPSGYVEPLHSVYLSEHAYSRGLKVLDEGKRRMQDLLDALHNVLYVSTLVLKSLDRELKSFVNFNNEEELRRLEKEKSSPHGKDRAN
jgi:molybdopterin-guanine dinucleotide biosynthesis protein A